LPTRLCELQSTAGSLSAKRRVLFEQVRSEPLSLAKGEFRSARRACAALPALLIAACLLAWSFLVRADDAAARSVFDAVRREGSDPSGCVDRAALSAQVVHWLGRSTIDARVAIEVRVEGGALRYLVRREGVAIGERALRLPNATCAEVRAALGLAI